MKPDNHPDADDQFNNSLYWYWNDDKLNFDNNWTDNANHNFGSAVGRFSLRLFFWRKGSGFTRALGYLTDFSQPPSIRPTSKLLSVKDKYFLLSKILVSLASRNISFKTANLLLAFAKIGSFHSRLAFSASTSNSSSSKIIALDFSPKAYLSLFGKVFVYS